MRENPCYLREPKLISFLARLRELSRDFFDKNIDNLFEFSAIIILGVLLLFDVLTTSLVIKAGGCETNVMMEGIVTIPMVHFLFKWLFLVLVVAAARFSDHIREGTGLYIMGVIIGWYSLVIVNNTLVFMKLVAGT